jgi:AraC-like DNA-binding protein
VVNEKEITRAYLQIVEKKGKKPGKIYHDLGFENLSHFSFAFKRKFGPTPNEIIKAHPRMSIDP